MLQLTRTLAHDHLMVMKLVVPVIVAGVLLSGCGSGLQITARDDQPQDALPPERSLVEITVTPADGPPVSVAVDCTPGAAPADAFSTCRELKDFAKRPQEERAALGRVCARKRPEWTLTITGQLRGRPFNINTKDGCRDARQLRHAVRYARFA